LPACPTGAISFEQREAVAFDEAAVAVHVQKMQVAAQAGVSAGTLPCGCPSAESKTLKPEQNAAWASTQAPKQAAFAESQLKQWPIQIKLVPPNAPFLHQANLLIAADCAAYVYGNFHLDYMKDRITLIGCPKLDDVDYTEKLTAMLRMNNILSVTVVRIEVPCCGGIEAAVRTALRNSGKSIPMQAVTISVDGRVL